MRWKAWLSAVLLVIGASPVWAQEESSAELKAEIEMLKRRLNSLEDKLVMSERRDVSGTSDQPIAGGIELPSGLQGLTMSGYADVSYIYNFAESDSSEGRNNRGRFFDTEPNGFTPHAFELALEKPITDEMPIGFRTDLVFGDDAELYHSTGLGNDAGPESPEAFDLQQLYVTARAPIGDGLDFKVGKFVTLLGAEVNESHLNWNFSRSFLFSFAIPVTHTGVLASYPLGEFGSFTGGVVNGWDIVDDNNKAKSLLGNITLTPAEGLTVAFNGITGAEQAGNSRDDRTVFDTVVTWQAMEDLTLMANYDYGFESAGKNVANFDSKNWTGLALYAKYDLSDTWALAGRLEWFDDKDNFRTTYTSIGGGTPADIDFYGYTLTSQWKLHEHVLARLEYRHDKADEKVFFHDANGFTSYQDTVAAELVYHF